MIVTHNNSNDSSNNTNANPKVRFTVNCQTKEGDRVFAVGLASRVML